ncbi:hypothetical protein BH10BAC5_BH10BAC5_25300 [soil metagenome]
MKKGKDMFIRLNGEIVNTNLITKIKYDSYYVILEYGEGTHPSKIQYGSMEEANSKYDVFDDFLKKNKRLFIF